MFKQKSDILKSQRQDYIDWLRIFAVLLLFPFHSARVFDCWNTFYTKNETYSMVLSYFVDVINTWHMPLFFLLAGASTWFALEMRSGRQYGAKRIKRLGIPLLFGLLVVVPPQAYYSLLRDGVETTIPHFLASYFSSFQDLSGYYGTFTPAHLWFIMVLLLISLGVLPLLLILRGAKWKSLLDQAAGFFQKPGALFLAAVPLALASWFPDIGGFINILSYTLFFFYGFILFTDNRLQEAVSRHKTAAFLGGVILMPLVLITYSWFAGFPEFSLPRIAYTFMRGFNAWFWLLAIVGYGLRYLNCRNKFLNYCREAAYPVYILHQTVIVAVAYPVVRWSVALGVKFTVIMMLSLVITVVIYDITIKRFNFLRFLFGMKPIRPKAVLLKRTTGLT